MNSIAQVIFFIASGLLVHSYILYPLIVKYFARGKVLTNREVPNAEKPFLSVILAVYNEEKVIRKKIESILDTTYPPNKIEILIGSDGSTDSTEGIIREIAEKTNNVFVKRFSGRLGKTYIINQLVPEAKGSILIFTDANIYFSRELFNRLTAHFMDNAIGLVGANILNYGMRHDGISMQEQNYITRENKIKHNEGLAWGTMMGAFGACYAIRRELFVPVKKNFFMEDFYITMQVLRKGKKTINDLSALAYEDVSNDWKEEFKRKIRISIGNFQNLSVFWRMMLPIYKPTGFCFASHKVIRWMGPFAILTAIISNAIIRNENLFFFLTFLLQCVGIISPFIDMFFKQLNIHNFAVRLCAYFYLMNLALFIGFIKYCRGINTSAWNPTLRNIESQK
jgi:glycosyltransferase involved in cell wall biosynthesis